jgi:hypothetical protein
MDEALYASEAEAPWAVVDSTDTASVPQHHVPASHASHRERDDAYPVIAQIDAKTRVINCKDDMQWIVQRRRCADNWTSMSFCQTREALIRDARRRAGDLPPTPLAVLHWLPEWHP